MTIRERIKRIANKLGVPYSSIKLLIYGQYGKSTINIDKKLKLLEKEYELQ